MIYLPLNNVYFHSIGANIVYLSYQDPETKVLTIFLTSLNECIQVITQIGEFLGTLLKLFKSLYSFVVMNHDMYCYLFLNEILIY